MTFPAKLKILVPIPDRAPEVRGQTPIIMQQFQKEKRFGGLNSQMCQWEGKGSTSALFSYNKHLLVGSHSFSFVYLVKGKNHSYGQGRREDTYYGLKNPTVFS